MIRLIKIENFKSLADVTITFDHFNCLIGMNGAGKSTVLQALDFISQLMIGNVEDWLDSRGWTSQELNSKLRKESNIRVSIGWETADQIMLIWSASFNRHDMRCSAEVVGCVGSNSDEQYDAEDLGGLLLPETVLFRVYGQSYRVRSQPKKDITFKYQGSILSQLKSSELPERILELRDAIRNIRSLELLSPHLMKKRARTDASEIGAGGEKLSGYLSTIKGEQRAKLLGLLKEFYPNLQDFKISNSRAGWKRLAIIEQFGDKKIETEASHLNDGLLRILAILSQTSTNRSLVLLDEVENGINQEVVGKLINILLSSNQQIVVTTHSPLVLNYLADSEAKRSVQFVYKSPQGETKLRHFFLIPRLAEKLELMGAGDAFVDTDLISLTEECSQLDKKEEEKKIEKN